MLRLNDGRKVLYQWDVGVTATVLDDQITQVHFSNLSYGISFSVEVVDGNVLIPPEVLQNGADIYCWAYVSTNEKSYTKKDITLNVIKRPKPSGYIYTPTDIETLESIKEELLKEIENVVVDTDNIKNGSITIDKVNQKFFADGIKANNSNEIGLNLVQKPNQKFVYLTPYLKNGAVLITEDTYINELESGIYRCKSENGVTLYFDANFEYGLVDGIAIVSHIEDGSYQWLIIGTDPAYIETTMLGTSVIDSDGTLVVESTKNLSSVVVSEELNQNVVIPFTDHITRLWNAIYDLRSQQSNKEDKSNKVTEIDADNTNEQYASAKAIYDFGTRILAEVEKMLENVNINASQLTAEAITTFTMNTSAEVKTDA